MSKGQRLATIIVSIILVMVVGGAAAFGLTALFGNKGGAQLSDKQVLKAIETTVDTLKEINQNNPGVTTLRTATEVTTDEIDQDVKGLMSIVPLVYISYIDYLIERDVLKVGTLQYDEFLEGEPGYETTDKLYTLVTQKDGLVYVTVKYDSDDGDYVTYTAYEIEYNFKKDELVGFNFVQFDDNTAATPEEQCSSYVAYRYNLKDGKVVLFNPTVRGLTSKQYQVALSNGRVDGEYISTNISYFRCFEGNLNDFTDYAGYDVDAGWDVDSRIDYESLTAEQKAVIIRCINGVKGHIIPYQSTVDAIVVSTAEHCDEISDANDYINETFYGEEIQ